MTVYIEWLGFLKHMLHGKIHLLKEPLDTRPTVLACIAIYALCNYVLRYATMFVTLSSKEEIDGTCSMELDIVNFIIGQVSDIIVYPIAFVAGHFQCIFQGPAAEPQTLKNVLDVYYLI
jgi:hypothetical protein